MSIWEGLLLIAVGIGAGFINTVAGGGSLITLPILIFMGLPSAMANASNRVAIFFQNIFSVQGFRSKGVFVYPYSIWVALSAMAGAVLGAQIAVDMSSELFNRILAIIMIIVIILTVFKPGFKADGVELFSKKKNTISIILFFGVGVYGGFIQAGIGFLMIAILTGIHNLPMAKTNSIKVFVALCYTSLALIVFILEDQVKWEYGLTLAIGNATGGWIASRWSVDKSDRLIRIILIVTVSALAIKLWFWS
ncbi:MAG: sulfite exporter TauE/SafE family protein [Cyclobacteriaceae bacterium]